LQYIHQGEFNESPNDNLPSFETDKDGRITEVEFWEAWIQSEGMSTFLNCSSIVNIFIITTGRYQSQHILLIFKNN